MFADLTCGHLLTEAEAGRCIAALRGLVGTAMFEARLSPDQLDQLKSNSNVTLAEQELRQGGLGAGGPVGGPGAWPVSPMPIG
jgi:hypothetical protein